jgi:Eukaryotic cytochrome b561
MTRAAQPNGSSSMPQLTGTSNISTKTQGSSYRAFVVLHALLLGFAFVVLFPLGTIALRHGWKVAFGAHWITQVTASVASLIGLALAIALSIIGVEYNGFDEAHQVLGLCVVALLAAQVLGGYWHHLNFKKLGRRIAVSHGHMWLGRCLIYSGMVNTVL